MSGTTQPTIDRKVFANDIVVLQHRVSWKEQAYLRFARVPHRVENCASPVAAGDVVSSASAVPLNPKSFSSPSSLLSKPKSDDSAQRSSRHYTSGDLPKVFDRHNVAGSKDTLAYFASHVYDLDEELSDEQCGQIVAYTALIQDVLEAALLQSQYLEWTGEWVQEGSCYEVSKAEMSKSMKPMRSKLLAWLASFVQRGKAKAYAKARQMQSAAHTEVQVHKAYQALDVLLSNGDAPEKASGVGDYRRPFVFKRSKPCSLDAVIFGHVASARMDKMTGFGELFEKQYPNLNRHYIHIYRMYFSQFNRANRMNAFFRSTEKARHALAQRKERIQSKPHTNKSDEADKSASLPRRGGSFIPFSWSSGSSVNVDHFGGYVNNYLPKKSLSQNGIYDFSEIGGNGYEYNSSEGGLKASKGKNVAAGRKSNSPKPKSDEQQRQSWENKLFLGGTALALIGYLVFTGRIAIVSDDSEY